MEQELKAKCFDLMIEREKAQVFLNKVTEQINKIIVELESLEKKKDGNE